jgi:hypothetical protein
MLIFCVVLRNCAKNRPKTDIFLVEFAWPGDRPWVRHWESPPPEAKNYIHLALTSARFRLRERQQGEMVLPRGRFRMSATLGCFEMFLPCHMLLQLRLGERLWSAASAKHLDSIISREWLLVLPSLARSYRESDCLCYRAWLVVNIKLLN